MLANGETSKRNVNLSSYILKLSKQLINNGLAELCGEDIYIVSSAIFSGATMLPAEIMQAVAN